MTAPLNLALLNSLLDQKIELGMVGTHARLETVLTRVLKAKHHSHQWEAFKFVLTIPFNGKQTSYSLHDGDYCLHHPLIGKVTLFGSPNNDCEIQFNLSYPVTSPVATQKERP